jgi:phosphomannomutase/phosphoglucomutase
MDGTFPGRLPEPSVEGLKSLANLVVSCKAAFGIAHDGDADRAVFVDENGHFIEENQEFALVVNHICQHSQGIIVTPVSTGQLVEIVTKKWGSSIIYTPVGSIYVARTMRSLIERGERVIFGGEGNGGLIFPEHQFCRDGGMTAAMMVSIVSSAGKKLSYLVNDLPHRYIIKDKISSPFSIPILQTISSFFPQDNIDPTDGVKIIRHDSWALIRASGTEPIIRIIIDAETEQQCQLFHAEITAKIALIVREQTSRNPE